MLRVSFIYSNSVNGQRWLNAMQLTSIIMQFVLYTAYDAPNNKKMYVEPEIISEKSEVLSTTSLLLFMCSHHSSLFAVVQLEIKMREEEAKEAREVKEAAENDDHEAPPKDDDSNEIDVNQPTESYLLWARDPGHVDEWDNSLSGSIVLHLNKAGKLGDAVCFLFCSSLLAMERAL
jgi:hypothetical protein